MQNKQKKTMKANQPYI